MFPQTCNDFSTVLSCSGGILNGNWQTYQYPSSQCHTSGALVSGIDLAIDGSPGIPGQEYTTGGLIAQSSPPHTSREDAPSDAARSWAGGSTTGASHRSPTDLK